MNAAESAPVDVVENYDDVWAYEPQQFRIFDLELWNRGVPRAALLYGAAIFAALMVVSTIPLIGAPLALFPMRLRVPMMLAAASGIAWWLWKLPPGGVVPHRAAAAVTRGLLAPRRLHGWVAASARAQAWSPEPLVVERDGRGAMPQAITFTGPGRVACFRETAQVVHRRGRLASALRLPAPAIARTFTVDERRRSAPQVLQIPAGVSVTFGQQVPR